MNIGDKVKFLDKNGLDIDRDLAKKHGLKRGEIYKLSGIEAYNWTTSIKLEGINGYFNSVMFEKYED